MGSKKITIIIPVYNEARQIDKSIETIASYLTDMEHDICFMIIDDGSADDTWKTLSDMLIKRTDIEIIRLSRNFGKESAICAGLENVSADACIIMDSDLQHPPSLIPEMIRLWDEAGYDIVEGVKDSRGRESIINKLGAHLFYYLMHKLSGVKLKNASDFKLMDKKVIDAWRKMPEHDTFMRGMTAWLGFSKTSLSFSVPEREEGRSRWSFFKLFKLAIDALTSFSSLPLHIVTVMGLIFLIGSVILGIHTIYQKLTGAALDGFTTIILLQLIIGSTLMLSLGIIGSYIARIFNEVKRRPRYLISEKLSSAGDTNDHADERTR